MPSGSETHQMFERSVCFPVSSVWMVVTCANRYYLTVSPGPPSCHWLLTQQTPLIRLFTLFPCSSFSVLLPPLMADVIFAHAAPKAFVFLVRRHFGLKLWNQSCCFFFFVFFYAIAAKKYLVATELWSRSLLRSVCESVDYLDVSHLKWTTRKLRLPLVHLCCRSVSTPAKEGEELFI